MKRDIEYELWLNKQLFKLGLLFTSKKVVPQKIGKQPVEVTSSMGHGEVRERINENLEFLKTVIKYSLFDLEATKRELVGKK